jgi:hypothetical protein
VGGLVAMALDAAVGIIAGALALQVVNLAGKLVPRGKATKA